MNEVKPIGFDPTGHEIITMTVKELLNQFPGLNRQKIYFEEQGDLGAQIYYGSCVPILPVPIFCVLQNNGHKRVPEAECFGFPRFVRQVDL